MAQRKGAKGRQRSMPDSPSPVPEGQLVLIRQPTGTIAVRTAEIVYPSTIDNPVPVPRAWMDQGEKVVELPSALTPIVEFVDPGEYIEGIYLGKRDGIGPHKSTMYDLTVAAGSGKEMLVSVWGSTILDAKFHLLEPPPGSKILVQYLGDMPTSRGLSPAKNFRVLYQAPSR